jgi:hypothetical protein
MNWLARLKNEKALGTHATKPTKPGFVGFVAPAPGASQKVECEAQTQPAPEPRWSDYTPASEEELARMMKRTEAFERMGLTFDEIDLVVDRLLRRDREGDDRHLCIECRHIRGSATGWRCDALRGAIPPDWVTIRLQRCPTFSAS